MKKFRMHKYNFLGSLTETSRHMTRMKKKYANRKFKKEELFGFDN